MTHRWVVTTFGIFALALSPAHAQSRLAKAASSENPRGLNGVWMAVGSNDISLNLAPGEEISFTAYGAQRYKNVDHMTIRNGWGTRSESGKETHSSWIPLASTIGRGWTLPVWSTVAGYSFDVLQLYGE